MSKTDTTKAPVCPHCEGEGKEPHPCPYDEEMNGGRGEDCTCCTQCETECARDV